MKLPTPEAIDDELARKSLAEFTKAMWHVIEPHTPLEWSWHHDCLCDHLQALLTDTLGKQNLLANVSPGSAKSTIVSVAAPAWMWLRKPSWSGTFAAADDYVCTRDSEKCRDVVKSSWYATRFRPKWHLRRGQDTKQLFHNTAKGWRRAVTVGSKIIGGRSDDLFIDDPLGASEAYSEAASLKALTWYKNDYSNRRNDMRVGHLCLIMQRLSLSDLAQYLIENELDDTEWLCIPMEWQEKQRRVTSLGWTDPRKSDGEVMDPKRYTPAVLRREKVRLGERGYAGQYQQQPVNLQGEIFRRGFIKFINPNHIPPATITQRLLSADTAIKEGEENDYSVLLEGWEFDLGVMLRSCLHEKMAYPALKEASKLKASQVQPSAFLIEDKASGQQVIQELQQTTSLPIVPIQVNKDKTARGWPLVPYWEAGRVFFPCDDDGNPEEWVAGFLEEIYAFPKAPHDDRYDAMVQLLTHLVLAPGARGLLEFYAAQQAKELAETAEQRKMDAIHHPVETIRLGGA